jgi:hypothetical protein
MTELLETVAKKAGQRAKGRKKDPDHRGNGESVGQNREEDRAEPVRNESFPGMNVGAIFKSAHPPPTAAEENGPLGRSEPDGTTVSQAFLNRLMDVFMESIGPIAPLIVRHHIGRLGESKDAFPKSRLDELVKAIEAEIEHPQTRSRFQKKIAEEIRNL